LDSSSSDSEDMFDFRTDDIELSGSDSETKYLRKLINTRNIKFKLSIKARNAKRNTMAPIRNFKKKQIIERINYLEEITKGKFCMT